MQETANKQKRISLKTVHEMLNGMSVELAEKVHLLFMANYIDYSDYEFRDENQVEGYCWCYRDLFELKTKESQEIVNSWPISTRRSPSASSSPAECESPRQVSVSLSSSI